MDVDLDQPRVFFDVEAPPGTPLGRVVITLFADVAPRTVENFRWGAWYSPGWGHHLHHLGLPPAFPAPCALLSSWNPTCGFVW